MSRLSSWRWMQDATQSAFSSARLGRHDSQEAVRPRQRRRASSALRSAPSDRRNVSQAASDSRNPPPFGFAAHVAFAGRSTIEQRLSNDAAAGTEADASSLHDRNSNSVTHEGEPS